MRILLVDDDGEFLASRTELLQSEGYEVEAISQEMAARAFILGRSGEIDIAVFDMLMEGSRDAGLRLVHLLSEHNLYIPIVVVTAHANWENVAECMEAGAFSYVPKEQVALLLPTLKRAEERRTSLLHRRVTDCRSRLFASLFEFFAPKCWEEFARLNWPTSITSVPDEQLRQLLLDLNETFEEAIHLAGVPDESATLRTAKDLLRSIPHGWIVNWRTPETAECQVRTYCERMPLFQAIRRYLIDVGVAPADLDQRLPTALECEANGSRLFIRIRLRMLVLSPEIVDRMNCLFHGEPISLGADGREELRLIRYAMQLTDVGATAEVSVTAKEQDTLVSMSLPIE